MRKTLHKNSPGVAHHLPHRTRLRIPKSHRDAESLKKLEDSLRKVQGVGHIRVSPETGTVVIHHDEHESILSLLGESISDSMGDVFKLLVAQEEAEVVGISILADLVQKLFGQADKGLASVSNNKVDLKSLVPVALLAVGVRKAMSTPMWWTEAPAYIFFYWAYDSYIKFHGPGTYRDEQPAMQEPLLLEDKAPIARGRKNHN